MSSPREGLFLTPPPLVYALAWECLEIGQRKVAMGGDVTKVKPPTGKPIIYVE